MSEDITSIKNIEAVAKRITYRASDRIEYFRTLNLAERSAVFNMLSASLRQAILSDLTFSEAVELLDHLDPRRVHYILSKMKDKKRRERLISRIKNDLYEKTEYFLQFHPRATVSLLHLNYVYLTELTTIGETAVVIEDHLQQTGKIPTVLVGKNGKLIGEVPLSSLVKERNTYKLKKFVKPIESIKYNLPPREILSALTGLKHKKMVILDHDESVIGLVYSDEVFDLLEAEPAATLYSFSGVEPSERPFDAISRKVKDRYRWLILNLATCFVAGFTISIFGDTLDQIVALAIFMPVVAGMAGNAGTQTLAVMIRGISVGEISISNSAKALYNEVGASLINGLIVGTLLVPIALLFGIDWKIVLVAFFAMVGNLAIACFSGGIIPLILKHLGKDPAASATVFITTATDVLGYLLLFGLATLVLL